MIDNDTTASNNLSNNQVASDNFSQNTLVSFNADFNGLEKTVGLLIPSVRNAIVERYRAETTCIILEKAIKIIRDNGLEVKPIPAKIALPLFDKLSLEHEEEMYDLWAKLLVSSTLNYDPISIYYAEILSKISSKEAKLLLEMYKVQTKYTSFMISVSGLSRYSEELEFFNSERFIFKELQINVLNTLYFIRRLYNIPTIICIKIKHCFKKLTTRAERDYRSYVHDLYDMAAPFGKQKYQHSLQILHNLGLVLKNPPVLTKLGYELVKTLERNNEDR